MYMIESPSSRASQPSNANWPWLRIWAYQTKALPIVFTICTYICDSPDKIVENTGPPVPNCRPQGQMRNIYKTNTVWDLGPKLSPSTAASISNESPQRILHNSYSHLSKTHNFGAQIGSQSQNCVQIWGRKNSPSRFVAWAFEPRFSPVEGMSI